MRQGIMRRARGAGSGTEPGGREVAGWGKNGASILEFESFGSNVWKILLKSINRSGGFPEKSFKLLAAKKRAARGATGAQ